MIELILVDWIFNRITILPTFIFLMGLNSSFINVLITSLVLDLLLGKWPFNMIVLNGLYFVNKKLKKRNIRWKYYYLINLFNLVIYYSLGFLIFSQGIKRYILSIGLIILINSLFWLGGYSLKNNS